MLGLTTVLWQHVGKLCLAMNPSWTLKVNTVYFLLNLFVNQFMKKIISTKDTENYFIWKGKMFMKLLQKILCILKLTWWPNVVCLILAQNSLPVNMMLGILLGCCLGVIIILILTRNEMQVCEQCKGTVHYTLSLLMWPDLTSGQVSEIQNCW